MAHKLIGPLVGAGLILGEAGYNYLRRSRPPLPPPSTSNSTRAARMAYGRGYSRKPSWKPKRAMRRFKRSFASVPRTLTNRFDSFKRTSGVTTLTLVAGAAGANILVRLSDISYDDLPAVYESFRIKRVTLTLLPGYDGGAAAAATATGGLHVTCACDPTGTAPAAFNSFSLSTISNHKYGTVAGGDNYTYSCFPKAKNTMDNAGSAVAVGSYGKYNPWINFNAPGPGVPHYNIMLGVQTINGSTQSVGYTLTIEFDCMRGR